MRWAAWMFWPAFIVAYVYYYVSKAVLAVVHIVKTIGGKR